MISRVPGPTKRPSVFFAISTSPNRIGGIERFAVELARQLDRRGWNLIMCFQDTPPVSVERFLLSPGNLSLAVMRKQWGVDLGNAKEFFHILRKHRPKVIMYSLGGVVRWWPLLGRLMGARRSVYWDGTSRTAKAVGYRASKQVKLVMSPLSAVVCATEFVKSCSDQEAIVSPEKTCVIYNSVDNDRDLGDGAAFRRRYGIPQDRIVVLLISWIVPEKGIDLALRAARIALQRRNDLHFAFCGEGANRREYERLSSELGIAEHVTWTGQVEDLAASGAFKAADMQIQCSQWQEAFCLAVAEGMSASLPVIASRIGGLPELVEDGMNGYLFDPSSELELANDILKLAADPELRSRLGQQGRKKALEKFDLARNAAMWVDVLLDDTRSRVKTPISHAP
jgi:glycosyltransferase involved in cell wall biosynthesis